MCLCYQMYIIFQNYVKLRISCKTYAKRLKRKTHCKILIFYSIIPYICRRFVIAMLKNISNFVIRRKKSSNLKIKLNTMKKMKHNLVEFKGKMNITQGDWNFYSSISSLLFYWDIFWARIINRLKMASKKWGERLS